MLYVIIKILLFPIVWLLFRPRIIGRENLRIKGAAIFVCNHISMIDPVIIMVATPRIVHFMAKAELFKNWFLNLFFRALLAFPVDRTKADMASLKKALHLLGGGKVFGIFPEGKRTITNDLDTLEKGAAFLASRSGAPIVPMYIKHDSYRRLHVKMMVGEPIQTGELIAATPKSKIIDVLTDEIGDALHALQAAVEE